MKKNLKTQFLTRQYMLSKDYELYYYSDSHMANVDSHTHDYYEFYFFLISTLSALPQIRGSMFFIMMRLLSAAFSPGSFT